MKEGYKKTELGWIPNDWSINKLSRISDIIMGQSPDSDTYNEDGIGVPFFQGKTEFGRTNPIVKKWCSKPTKIAEPLDILISVRAPVGEVNINNVQSCIGRGLAAIRQRECNYKYIYYYIQSIKEKLNSSAQGSTFTAINSSDLKNVEILTPLLKEQEKIADVLSTVDSQIDNTNKLIEKTNELKKGLMQRLLTKGIGHKEFKNSEVGKIPVEWEVRKLNDICEINPKKEVLHMDDSVTFISMEQISNAGRVVWSDIRKYGEIYKGYTAFKNRDVLLAKITPCFENGKRAIVDNLINGVGFGSTEFHVLRADNKYSIPEFIYYYISTHNFRELAEANMTGSAGQKRVPTSFLKDTRLIVPSIEEQKEITDILSSVDAQIEEYENKKAKLEELKKGLMQQLLTGKIRVV